MISFRGMFNQLFHKEPYQPESRDYIQFSSLNNAVNLYYAGGKNNYESLFVRVCIDTIAENAAKLKAKVIREKDEQFEENIRPDLENLLNLEPNPYMNAFEFYYKVVSSWLLENNSFIYIDREPLTNKVIGLYPISYSSCVFKEAVINPKVGKELFVKFEFQTGASITLPYTELIHLRRFFASDDLFGSDNDKTLKPQIGLLNVVNKGFATAVNNANFLRGILKFTQNLKDDDLIKQKERFSEEYLNLKNNGGIAAIDSRAEYQELKQQAQTADDKQMSIIRSDIMNYFHVSEAIISANYNEDEWSAFYESVIEPIGIRLGLEMTRKIYTPRERAFGNRIEFEANRLQYTSAQSKIKLLKEIMPMGLMSINEGREILNLAPIEDGEKRIVSLNYIDANKANKYQVGEDENTADDKGEGGEADDNAEQ